MRSPGTLQHALASELLAASAAERSPAECFAIAHDLLRLSQDYAIGAGMGTSLVAMHNRALDLALALEPRCLQGADEEALHAAERELAILARHPAPTGVMLDVDLLRILVMSLGDVEQAPLVPLSRLGLERWLRATATLDAVETLLPLRAEVQTIGEDYPSDLARVERWQREIEASNSEFIASLAPELGSFVREDAASRAVVRLLWAGVRLRLEHARAPAEPPSLLDDPDLRDPLTGEAFRWIPDAGGSRLTIRAAPPGERDASIALRLVWPDVSPSSPHPSIEPGSE